METDNAESSEGTSPVVCGRCKENKVSNQIRAELVCQSCFKAYVRTKCIKRMETYKSRAASKLIEIKNILLPLSFGPSSSSLLNILDKHLQGQRDRMGRTSYRLIVAHITASPDHESHDSKLFEKVKVQFPSHTYISAPLPEALNLSTLDWSSLDLPQPLPRSANGYDQLQTLLSALPSPTSRADVLGTLQTHLLVSLAKSNDCSSLLFAHSTTRLAEKVLIETASGRGFSLPYQVRDGASPFGVEFAYPMRDLLSKEISAFAQEESKLEGLVVWDKKAEVAVSAKNTTVDELMKAYFASVEENYPSIVANVVRTSSKLEASTSQVGDSTCGLCNLPVEQGTDGIFGWGGDQRVIAREEHKLGDKGQKTGILCYGCSRSVNG